MDLVLGTYKVMLFIKSTPEYHLNNSPKGKIAGCEHCLHGLFHRDHHILTSRSLRFPRFMNRFDTPYRTGGAAFHGRRYLPLIIFASVFLPLCALLPLSLDEYRIPRRLNLCAAHAQIFFSSPGQTSYNTSSPVPPSFYSGNVSFDTPQIHNCGIGFLAFSRASESGVVAFPTAQTDNAHTLFDHHAFSK